MLQVEDVLKDKYRIEREIARGGMGAVYLATNEEYGTPVAIKEILENQATNQNARDGFLREANFLLNLDHPNLPRVFEVFEEKNLLYVVMRYIAGKDLFERLAEGHKPDGTAEPLPLSDVLAIADTLLGALEYLHGLKSPVIHRDIKPSNLKIGPDGTLYLLDFGLAKTVVTVAYGHTPGFASPEQENHERTDARSDLYSVGATLYSLLAGLYQLPTAQTRFAAHLRNDPDPVQPLDRLNTNVPRAICEVFEKAMALDPAERPASAKEVREMLKATLNTSPLNPVIDQSEFPEPNIQPETKGEEPMDQLVTKLLQEIENGNKHFQPASDSEADTKKFQATAKALIWAENEGLLDGLRVIKEHQTGNDWYVLAYVTNGLSYKGQISLTQPEPPQKVKKGELVKTLMRVIPAQITQLALIVDVPTGVIPNGVPQTEVVNTLVRWADSEGGCGLDVLQQELDEMLGKR